MKKATKPDESVNTIIGNEASFEGTVEFSGSIRIDGRVKGKITSDSGTLIIGESAKIEADIFVSVAIIRGDVAGKIDANDRIEVYPPGRIHGDIVAPVISIDTGVIFNGNCEMTARTITSGKKDGKRRKNENPDGKSNAKTFVKTG